MTSSSLSFPFDPRPARFAACGESTRRWILASGLVAAAALLSAGQIWLRQSVEVGISRSEPSPFAFLVFANLVAWVPWVPLGLAAVRVARSLRSAARWRLALGHALASQAVTWAFLAYLSVFRALFVPEVAGPHLAEGWSRLLAREASDFYLVCLLLYAAIVLWAVRRRQEARLLEAPAGPVAAEPGGSTSAERRIEVRSVSRTLWVAARNVEWIEAAGNYSRLHTGDRAVLHRRPLKEMVAELEAQGFVRAHRSHALRLSRVESMRVLSHGDAEVTLRGGRVLRVSRRHREEVQRGLRALAASSRSSR